MLIKKYKREEKLVAYYIRARLDMISRTIWDMVEYTPY